MSLINDMLRDLEARRAGELAKPGLQREIRPLPERRTASAWRFAAAAGIFSVAVIGGMALWWQGFVGFDRQNAPPVTAPTSGFPIEAQLPAQTLSSASIEVRPAAVSDALRLATSLELAPTADSEARSLREAQPLDAKAVTPPKVMAAKPDQPSTKDDAPAKAKPPEMPSGSVEKIVVMGSPRERADADYRRAQGLLAAGQTTGAHDALLGALRQDATYVAARQTLLRLLLEASRVDEAIAVMKEGLELQPTQINWAMSLARLMVERGDTASAERILSQHAQYASVSPEYAGFHGHLLYRIGHFRAAVERYLAATRLAPADGRWWFGLGQALDGEGNSGEARDAYRRAMATGNLNADLTALAEQKIR